MRISLMAQLLRFIADSRTTIQALAQQQLHVSSLPTVPSSEGVFSTTNFTYFGNAQACREAARKMAELALAIHQSRGSSTVRAIPEAAPQKRWTPISF